MSNQTIIPVILSGGLVVNGLLAVTTGIGLALAVISGKLPAQDAVLRAVRIAPPGRPAAVVHTGFECGAL